MQNQQNINIPLKDTTEIICEECKSNKFTEAVLLRKVSKFITGTTEDGVIPIPLFVCFECGHVNKEFLPKDKQNENI